MNNKCQRSLDCRWSISSRFELWRFGPIFSQLRLQDPKGGLLKTSVVFQTVSTALPCGSQPELLPSLLDPSHARPSLSWSSRCRPSCLAGPWAFALMAASAFKSVAVRRERKTRYRRGCQASCWHRCTPRDAAPLLCPRRALRQRPRPQTPKHGGQARLRSKTKMQSPIWC